MDITTRFKTLSKVNEIKIIIFKKDDSNKFRLWKKEITGKYLTEKGKFILEVHQINNSLSQEQIIPAHRKGKKSNKILNWLQSETWKSNRKATKSGSQARTWRKK